MTLTLEQLYEVVAQECHAAVAFGYVLALYLFERVYLWWGILVLLAVVAVKEVFIDPRTEPNEPPWPSGAEDWAFYLPGVVLALLLLHFGAGFPL